MNEIVNNFILGSSPVVTLPPLLVLTLQSSCQLPWPVVLLTPVVFGIIFTALNILLTSIPHSSKDLYPRFILSGAITGLVVSFLLEYYFNIYSSELQMSERGVFKAHVFIAAFYAALFITTGQWLRRKMGYRQN